MLCIMDYGSGNISAISNICEREGIPHFVSSDAREFPNASHFLLPGVGSFDPTMHTIRASGCLLQLHNQVFGLAKPVLGICIGMHLLSDGSEEGLSEGLGWISGRVKRIDVELLESTPHLPHMGWNSVEPRRDDPLLKGIDLNRGFYFLHSFQFDTADPADILATTRYGGELPCIVRRGNIIGAQFHPEKSHSNGVRFIKNFIEIA